MRLPKITERSLKSTSHGLVLEEHLAMTVGQQVRQVFEFLDVTNLKLRRLAISLAGMVLAMCPVSPVIPLIAQQTAPSQTTVQSVTAALPRFDVVSLKPCKPGDGPGGGGGRVGGGGGAQSAWSPGSINTGCQTVAYLIQWAYLSREEWAVVIANRVPRILQEPIKGGPAWINSDHYQVVAKAEGPANLETMKGGMMQTLLEERFQLKVHREIKEVSAYELTATRGGPKLQPAMEGGCVPLEEIHRDMARVPGTPAPRPCGYFFRSGPDGGLDSPGATMTNLCYQLSVVLDRQVVDKTGIIGKFDIHLELSSSDLAPDSAGIRMRALSDPGSTGAAADSAGSAFLAAVERLGLRLNSANGSGDYLVIDRVEKPSEN